MKIFKHALLNALLAFLYIYLVASLLTIAQAGKGMEDNPPLAGVAMLLTLVLSVAVMGVLIFGKPIIWYLDNKKKEALILLGYTLGLLLVAIIVVFGMII